MRNFGYIMNMLTWSSWEAFNFLLLVLFHIIWSTTWTCHSDVTRCYILPTTSVNELILVNFWRGQIWFKILLNKYIHELF